MSKNKKTNSYDVKVEMFTPKESEDAINKYNLFELDSSIDFCALVSVQEAKNLEKAYPNYFGSTKLFRNFLKDNFHSMIDYYMQKSAEQRKLFDTYSPESLAYLNHTQQQEILRTKMHTLIDALDKLGLKDYTSISTNAKAGAVPSTLPS